MRLVLSLWFVLTKSKNKDSSKVTGEKKMKDFGMQKKLGDQRHMHTTSQFEMRCFRLWWFHHRKKTPPA
jgi:hypothetical protein